MACGLAKVCLGRGPSGAHAVGHAQQYGFDLADLAFGGDLEDLVDHPRPRRRVAHGNRASILELVVAQRRIVVKRHAGHHQSARFIDGNDAPAAQPRVLAVVAQAEGLAATVVQRSRRRARGHRPTGGGCAVLEPIAVIGKRRHFIAKVVFQPGEIAVGNAGQFFARQALRHRDLLQELRARRIAKLVTHADWLAFRPACRTGARPVTRPR